MKKLILITTLFFAALISAQGQTVDCPPNTICLTQEQANIAAQNARENKAKDEKIKVLEEALQLEKQNTADVRETARKNEADLREALVKTQTELATKTGQLIATEASLVRVTAITEFLLKHGRKKCYGLCVQF